MAESNWSNSNRRTQLPGNWATLRKSVMERDNRLCQHIRYDTGLPCYLAATDVDHIEPGDDHRLSNLQALCAWHHRQKTGRESGEARKAKSAGRGRKPRHPGVIGDFERPMGDVVDAKRARSRAIQKRDNRIGGVSNVQFPGWGE